MSSEGASPSAEILSAPYLLEYTYRRAVGPVVGRFLGALRDGRIEGARAPGSRRRASPRMRFCAIRHRFNEASSTIHRVSSSNDMPA